MYLRDESVCILKTKPNLMRLLSTELEVFIVERAVAARSVLLKNFMDDNYGPDDDTDAGDPFPLTNIKSATLIQVIAYLNYHEGPGQIVEYNEMRLWDLRFVRSLYESGQTTGDVKLFDILLAANFLDIKSLLDLTCMTVAEEIKSKSPAEIRDRYGIGYDLDPQKRQQVEDENAWVDEI